MVFNIKIGLLYECFPAEEDLILPSGETILRLFFYRDEYQFCFLESSFATFYNVRISCFMKIIN